MSEGELDLTPKAVVACLKQLLESDEIEMTDAQRYSLGAAIEAVAFVDRISGPLKKALES